MFFYTGGFMKILYIFAALILLSALLFGCGGSNTEIKTNQTVDTAKNQTEPNIKETEPATEAPEPVPEAVKQLSFSCSPAYKERITESNGEASYSSLRMKIEYESKFYGYQSAINHDFVCYGRNFEFAKAADLPKLDGDISGADIDGDGYAELFHCKNGVLSVYSLSMIYKKQKIWQPNARMTLDSSLLCEFEIGADLHLCGAGDLNGDSYSDILFYSAPYAVIYYGNAEGFVSTVYRFDTFGKPLCGDIDGDGTFELIDADGLHIMSYKITDGKTELFTDNYINADIPDNCSVYAADINSDGLTDIVYSFVSEKLMNLRSFFGRGDGRFGCYEADGDNKNLYSEYKGKRYSENIGFADFTGSGAYAVAGTFTNSSTTMTGILFENDDLAYDYSLFGMRVNGEYRIYSGVRWSDENINGDGDHVMLSTSSDGVNWRRYIDAPMFYLGRELGIDEWWSDNTLEPEVLYADGVYHMYWQCSYITPKGNYGDKIGYASSTDGIHWERKTDEPAIICSNPEIGFNHEEVLYVADDPDGKPYWMYTGHFVNGQFSGYIRIRSSEPDRFLYTDRESTDGFAQIGNQLAYFYDEDGKRIFVRITFCDADDGNGNTVWRPTLYFSKDGLKFYGSKYCVLAGVDTEDPRTELNRNMFFLGMITENGTGELIRNDDGSYRIIYLATTCASSVAPDIFYAEAGVGIMDFKLTK